MDRESGNDGWKRDIRITVARMALVFQGPPLVYLFLSGFGDPGPDGNSGKYDLRYAALVAGVAAAYAVVLAVPDHLLARRGRKPVAFAHATLAALAVAFFAVGTAVHTWTAVIPGLMLVAMGAGFGFAVAMILGAIQGSFPPLAPKIAEGAEPTSGGDVVPD